MLPSVAAGLVGFAPGVFGGGGGAVGGGVVVAVGGAAGVVLGGVVACGVAFGVVCPTLPLLPAGGTPAGLLCPATQVAQLKITERKTIFLAGIIKPPAIKFTFPPCGSAPVRGT
jgi:hypothetical protein